MSILLAIQLYEAQRQACYIPSWGRPGSALGRLGCCAPSAVLRCWLCRWLAWSEAPVGCSRPGLLLGSARCSQALQEALQRSCCAVLQVMA